MSVPLSDTRLAEIRERVPSAVCLAAHPAEVDKGHVWVTGSLSGAKRCSACHLSQRALDSDEAVLLAEVDRLRAELAERHYDSACPAVEERNRLRADLERIQRWATTTVHGSAAAEVLLLIRDLAPSAAAPFRNCFTDEAYRSSLTASPERPCDGVQPHPAHKHVAQRASWQCPGVAAAPEPSCGVLNPKVAATCTEPNDHPSPIHRDAFGNTWTRREGERPLGAGR